MDHPLAKYASANIQRIWSDPFRFRLERELWCHVLRFHIDHGVFDDRPENMDQVWRAYSWAASQTPDLANIQRRERITKHDLKARIEEFVAVANWDYNGVPEVIHAGMTSADVVDNISLIQMRTSLEELDLPHLSDTAHFIPFRGIKGPVGTQQDQLDLLGSPELCDKLDRYLADIYGFKDVMGSIGQIYPRSLDLQVGSHLLAAMVRTGNQRKLPWRTIFNGYYDMVVGYSGDQWNEGDVSTSVIRRIALPGMFLAADCAFRKVDP